MGSTASTRAASLSITHPYPVPHPQAREEDFRAMLREANVVAGTKWAKVKEELGGDPRLKAVPHSRREPLFRAYVDKLEVSMLTLQRD